MSIAAAAASAAATSVAVAATSAAAEASMSDLNDENKISYRTSLASGSVTTTTAAAAVNASTINSIMKTLMGAYASHTDSPELAQYIDQAVYSLKKTDGQQEQWAGYKQAKENSNSENQNSADPAASTPSTTGAASSSAGASSNGAAQAPSTSHNNGSSGGGGSGGGGVHEDAASVPASLVKSEIPFHKKEFSKGQRDILRVIGQFLRYMGLNKTTEMLIDESGCMLEHPAATTFCSLVMSGNWDEAEKALNNLRTLMDDSGHSFTNMKFLILEQKYLECLEDGKIFEALKCLRDEMAPLKYNTDRLHELSSFLMCSDQSNLKTLSKWGGKNLASRQNLMDKLQTFLPPHIMLPPHRLEALLKQSIELQCERCPYHNSKQHLSIDNWPFLRDHVCSKDEFPSATLQVLNDHCDEVWFCKFSNDGRYLASGSKDGCMIIWDVDPVTCKLSLNKTYEDHTCGVGHIAWSPDNRYVIVCGTEECTEIWIWDVENKVLKKRLNNNHDDSLTCAAWLPDGQHFVTGGIKGQFYYCDLDGNVKDTWEGIRVKCLQVLPDGTVLAADALKRIRAYNFKEISDYNLIQEDFQIMSFTLNTAGTLALINIANQGVHLWDLKDKVLIKRFQGAQQTNFLNNSSFGGVDENYIASGSEDNKIYLWNIRKEVAINVLEGHTRNVNCVSWNPVVHGMIVSASDDGSLRVWGPTVSAEAPCRIACSNCGFSFVFEEKKALPTGATGAEARGIDLEVASQDGTFESGNYMSAQSTTNLDSTPRSSNNSLVSQTNPTGSTQQSAYLNNGFDRSTPV